MINRFVSVSSLIANARRADRSFRFTDQQKARIFACRTCRGALKLAYL